MDIAWADPFQDRVIDNHLPTLPEDRPRHGLGIVLTPPRSDGIPLAPGVWSKTMTIEVSHHRSGYLVIQRSSANETLGAVRFAERGAADEFAALWRDWLGTPYNAPTDRPEPPHWQDGTAGF